MPVFVTSTSVAQGHGVFALERNPPTTIAATNTSRVALVAQFPWGPDQSLETLTDNATFLNTVAPAGMSRTGSGYMAWMGKGWADFKWVRVLGSGKAKSTCTLTAAGPVNIVVLTLKYNGVAGNSCTATVSAASDGDANHFNLAVTVTGASGTTTDFIQNLNYSAVGVQSTPDLTTTLLLGSITLSNTGRPTNGTYTFAGGADGSIVSSAYIGTAGAGDQGIALLESDPGIRFLFVDDCGNTLRAAVNAGAVAHADLMTDRIAIINGNSGQTIAGAITDVGGYRSLRACYVDPWVYVNDDITGAKTLVPSAGFLASVASQLSPSTSPAWKSSKVRAMLRRIVGVEALRGNGRVSLTAAGICTLMPGRNGGFVFEAAVITDAPNSPNKKNMTRTMMGHYIASSEVDSLQESVDSPNVPLNQQDEINAVDDFLSTLKRNATTDPNNLPHILDFQINSIKDFNPQTELDAGHFTIPQAIKTSSAQEQIFLSLQYGDSVKIKVDL